LSTIEERRLAATVVVNEPEPVIRHAASTTGAITAGTALVDRLRSTVKDIIDRPGEFRITTEVGLLLATKEGHCHVDSQGNQLIASPNDRARGVA
jgi:hypothetical protein